MEDNLLNNNILLYGMHHMKLLFWLLKWMERLKQPRAREIRKMFDPSLHICVFKFFHLGASYNANINILLRRQQINLQICFTRAGLFFENLFHIFAGQLDLLTLSKIVSYTYFLYIIYTGLSLIFPQFSKLVNLVNTAFKQTTFYTYQVS